MTYEPFKSFAKLLLRRGVFDSYAQDGEDALAWSLLKRRRNGTYVDVGAYHPTLYSNTYALYRRGWRGVAVDANASLAPLYAVLRPRDHFVAAAVGKEDGAATYFRFKDGAYNTLSPEEAARWRQEKRSLLLAEEPVAVRPLRDVLKEAGVQEVDFLSIDIEGMDLQALESYDWSMPPSVIAIEDNGFLPDEPEKSACYRFLREKGYRLGASAPRTPLFVREGAVV